MQGAVSRQYLIKILESWEYSSKREKREKNCFYSVMGYRHALCPGKWLCKSN
jgi:hypothetical protein